MAKVTNASSVTSHQPYVVIGSVKVGRQKVKFSALAVIPTYGAGESFVVLTGTFTTSE